MSIELIKKCSITFIAIAVAAVLFRGCADTMSYEKRFDSAYTSPLGTRTILVRYDYVSRPSVFINGERLFYYKGRGFNETVSWGVTWASEQQIVLSYNDSNDEYDEKFYIDIP